MLRLTLHLLCASYPACGRALVQLQGGQGQLSSSKVHGVHQQGQHCRLANSQPLLAADVHLAQMPPAAVLVVLAHENHQAQGLVLTKCLSYVATLLRPPPALPQVIWRSHRDQRYSPDII
jgi:hypothetical protein